MPASKLLMIEPVNFCFNPETAVNNAFQTHVDGNVQQEALAEFTQLVAILRENKLDITVIKDNPEPPTPDAIFPNNWISFHEKNKVFLYPMFAANRRLERKSHVLDALKKEFQIEVIHDLSYFEKDNLFLEGTGSMVLDPVNRIAYAAISERTDLPVLNEFCRLSNYIPVSFLSKDAGGGTIYHSNVMMCVGISFVVICLDAIAEETDRNKLRHLFFRTNKKIIDISLAQLGHFAGNMLQVINSDNELLIVMSTRAYNSLNSGQRHLLEQEGRIIHSPVDTIETCGGGSVRCMLAEIFNQTK